MSCLESCEKGGKHFYFSRRQSTFYAARILCRNKDAILAQNLDGNDYQILSSCCFHESQYWIGLAEKPTCHQNMSYQWTEDSSSCTDGKPLTISRKPNNGKCQAIALTLTPNNQAFVRANEVDCTLGNRFICQLSSKTTTTPSFRLNSSVQTSSTDQTAQWPLIGAALWSFALLIAFLATCFYVRRKNMKKRSKKVNQPAQRNQSALSSEHETTNDEEEHTYCRIIDDLESTSTPQEPQKSDFRMLESAQAGYEKPEVRIKSQALAVEGKKQEQDSDYAQVYEHQLVPQHKKIYYNELNWQEPDYVRPIN